MSNDEKDIAVERFAGMPVVSAAMANISKRKPSITFEEPKVVTRWAASVVVGTNIPNLKHPSETLSLKIESGPLYPSVRFNGMDYRLDGDPRGVRSLCNAVVREASKAAL